MVGQMFNEPKVLTDLSRMKDNVSLADMSSDALLAHIKKSMKSSVGTHSSDTGLSVSLESIASGVAFWESLFTQESYEGLYGKLYDLCSHCHVGDGESDTLHFCSPSHEKKPADLWSLCNPLCSEETCGPYLFPLCYSPGSAFSPKYAATYLSWVLYLSDDLHERLAELRREFSALGCSKHCKCASRSCNNNTKCHTGGASGCKCDSVVSCSDVFPLLYSHGFRFLDAVKLNSGNKKKCAAFHTSLSNIIKEHDTTPLWRLLTTVDEFMYHLRFRFMSMVSSSWLCSLLILLYFIFYGIDVLHLKSHLHFPSSHGIPPITLLTTGKAPSVSNLTYFMTDLT
ncbi:extracellular matrix-binding ebh, putative [Babesia caballi]|uniref:Extracellular matrix-binding ebh, putative n=1 Tax=Babesia caballi TaxID=5871 RepID=A0AAV4LTL2_BABCB|nr:extracellular matrix-binding ebh, putative [Babesia caballi]